VSRREPGQPGGPSSASSAGFGLDPDQNPVLRVFLQDGRLTAMPAKWSKRMVVLDYLAQVFEPGTHYTEDEASALLRAFHPDYAMLRRYLVDEGFLDRADGIYWRSGGTFLL